MLSRSSRNVGHGSLSTLVAVLGMMDHLKLTCRKRESKDHGAPAHSILQQLAQTRLLAAPQYDCGSLKLDRFWDSSPCTCFKKNRRYLHHLVPPCLHLSIFTWQRTPAGRPRKHHMDPSKYGALKTSGLLPICRGSETLSVCVSR